MIRLVVIALIVLLVWLAALQTSRFLKTRSIDWTGVAFCIGFVALAIFLRQTIGLG